VEREQSSGPRRWEGGLTEHGLQPNQARDEVVKVDGEVFLRVAQDDQLEQVIGQLDSCRGRAQTKYNHVIGCYSSIIADVAKYGHQPEKKAGYDI
jgi:hypothetical protein